VKRCPFEPHWLLVIRLPALEVGLLDEPGRLHLRREEEPHQIRIQALAPAAFDDAVQQFVLTFGVCDGQAGIPFAPRDLLHQGQPLPHEAQQTVEGRQVGLRHRSLSTHQPQHKQDDQDQDDHREPRDVLVFFVFHAGRGRWILVVHR
jgi:hypothetical protein